MTLDQYLDDQSSPGRQERVEVWTRVTDALAEAGLNHVAETIEDECRFPEAAWNDLFTALDEAEVADVSKAMTQVFQGYVLEGPKIPDAPSPKGRAIDANRFLNWLDDQDVFASPFGKRRFLDDVQGDSSPAPPSHQQLRELELGQHLIWATFREEVFDPFAEWTTAQEIRTELGLVKPVQPNDQKLFLLVYRLPEDVSVRYPTIAEAYATKGEWTRSFQCAPPEAPWGYTVGNAPEVVHEVIQGVHLIDPDVAEANSISAVRIVD